MHLNDIFVYTKKIKEFDNSGFLSLFQILSKSSSNFILFNGTLLTGMNNATNPPILIVIDIEYNIDSGNTKEYHPKNSPNAKSPNPKATETAPLFLLSLYYNIVSIAPYTNKINEIDLKICSS